MTITLELELHSSKNGQQIIYSKKLDRPLIVKKISARVQDNQLKVLLMANKRKWDKMIEGKQYPLKVGFYVWRKTKRRFDWCNIVQGIQDSMVKNGYIPDDNASYLTPVFLGWDVDSERPRVEICVL